MKRAPKSIAWTLLLVWLAGASAAWAENVLIPRRTPLYAVLTEDVSSKRTESNEGDVVFAEVYRDVEIDGELIIAEGAELKLKIVEAQKRRMLGRKGHLAFEPIAAEAVDGTEIPLTGAYERDGKGRKAATGVLAVLVAWPFLFLHGKNAVVPAGTVLELEVDEDTLIATATSTAR